MNKHTNVDTHTHTQIHNQTDIMYTYTQPFGARDFNWNFPHAAKQLNWTIRSRCGGHKIWYSLVCCLDKACCAICAPISMLYARICAVWVYVCVCLSVSSCVRFGQTTTTKTDEMHDEHARRRLHSAAAARATQTRRQHNVFVRHLRASPSHLSDVATPSPNHDKWSEMLRRGVGALVSHVHPFQWFYGRCSRELRGERSRVRPLGGIQGWHITKKKMYRYDLCLYLSW